MRVLIVAAGSRGDVAPFTGLGTALGAAGHHVTIAGYEASGRLVAGCGLDFTALPGDPRILDAARWQRGATGPLGAARLARLIGGHLRELHAGMLAAARADVDVLLLSGMAGLGGFHIAAALGLPSAGLALQPIYPTAEFPPSTVAARSLGRLGNRAAGEAQVLLGTPVLGPPLQELRASLGLPKIGTRAAVFGRQHALRWPAFHGFSPAVVPRPADWRDGLQVSGYWWPARPLGWSPPAELEDFLSTGPAPVFVSFGSMTPDRADRLSDLVAAAGRQARVRLVIQAGAAGLGRDRRPAADSIVVGDLPHDWLFPQMAALVHHAGAGTTGAGLRAGVPAVTVPVLGDQPFWAARVAALGAGPRPIPFRWLSAPALSAAIQDAVARPSYRVQARALAGRLAEEDGAAPVARMLARLAGSAA